MKPYRMTGLVSLMLLWAPLSFAATPAPDSPAAKQEAEKSLEKYICLLLAVLF